MTTLIIDLVFLAVAVWACVAGGLTAFAVVFFGWKYFKGE